MNVLDHIKERYWYTSDSDGLICGRVVIETAQDLHLLDIYIVGASGQYLL